MVTMKPVRLQACLLYLSLAISTELVAAPGLPTRDQNPILQPIFLPGYISLTEEPGWRIDHALYITNTTQEKSNSREAVVIDSENYRYELMLGYRQDDWVWQIRMPYMANEGGQTGYGDRGLARFFRLFQR